jgi:hypothetical protein
VRRSEGWIHGRDSSVGIATSYRLDGPGSIFRYSQFFIRSVFLCITYLLTHSCTNVFAFCIFCITVTHFVFYTTYVLLFTYC